MRSEKLVMVGRRVYWLALSRLSTAWTISFLKAGLERADVNVGRERRFGGEAAVVFSGAGLLIALGDELLGFADAQAFADDFFGDLFL